MKNLELIADKAAVHFLSQFEDVGESVRDTIKLIEREIAGDNPTKTEWFAVADANASANAVAYAYAVAVAYAYANAYAYAYANAYAYVFAYVFANAYANAYAYAYADKTADYIIELMGSDLTHIVDLDKRVLTEIEKDGQSLNMDVWHSECGTTHCRAGWEVTIHPQGTELEKHFGTWMAATIIHKVSTGKTVDYFATNEAVIADLQRI